MVATTIKTYSWDRPNDMVRVCSQASSCCWQKHTFRDMHGYLYGSEHELLSTYYVSQYY